jgi:hypothetical protein
LGFVSLPTSAYFDFANREMAAKDAKETSRKGRPIPGYSLSKTGEGERVSDEAIEEMIVEYIDGNGYAAGYRKIRDDRELKINHKKVYRLCKKLGVLRPQRPIFAKVPRKLSKKPKAQHQTSCGKWILSTATSHQRQILFPSIHYRCFRSFHNCISFRSHVQGSQVAMTLEECLRNRN